MRTLLLLLPLVGIIAALPAAPPAPAPMTDDELDLVFFHDDRPIFIRLHLQFDGRPFSSLTYLDDLFRFLDVDGDGALSKAELSHAPNAEQLMQQFQGGGEVSPGQFRTSTVEPGPAPPFEEVDVAPADGKVTLAELAGYYRRHGAGALQVELGYSQGRTDPLTDALFRHLDANKDGKLSRAELEAAFAVLRRLDSNDDEMITLDELSPGNFGHEFVFRPLAAAPGGAEKLPFLLRAPADPPDPLVRRLLAVYDRDGDGKLTRAEAGIDTALFDHLDTNGDGALDAAELARWPEYPPDCECILQLGPQPFAEALRLCRAPRPGDGPLQAEPTKGGNGVVFTLPGVRMELHRNEEGRQSIARRRQSFRERFEALDRNKDGFLDSKEIFQPPFEFVALLRLADRDGDGRLSMKELDAYAELQVKAPDMLTILTLADRGRTLFELLDANHDGRLSQRELKSAWARLVAWDRDGDGCISRREIPRQFLVSVSPGRPGFTRQMQMAPGYGPAYRSAPPRGPLWFRRMDRNGDGDVSPREFLGTPADFKRLDKDGDGLIDPDEAEQADCEARKQPPAK